MCIGFYLYKGANLAEKVLLFGISEMDQPKFCTVLMMVYILKYSLYLGIFPVPVV
jgi:hypothetical protein